MEIIKDQSELTRIKIETPADIKAKLERCTKRSANIGLIITHKKTAREYFKGDMQLQHVTPKNNSVQHEEPDPSQRYRLVIDRDHTHVNHAFSFTIDDIEYIEVVEGRETDTVRIVI